MRWEAGGLCWGADPGRAAGGARGMRSRKMSSVIAAAAGARREEPVPGLQGTHQRPRLHLHSGFVCKCWSAHCEQSIPSAELWGGVHQSACWQAMNGWMEGGLGKWFSVPYKGPRSVSLWCFLCRQSVISVGLRRPDRGQVVA